MKKRIRRAMLAMKNTCIGERPWNGDFSRRTKMFDALVITIWVGNLGMEEGEESGLSKKKIPEMDYATGPQHAQLYPDERG